jgi:hypothetical protein
MGLVSLCEDIQERRDDAEYFVRETLAMLRAPAPEATDVPVRSEPILVSANLRWSRGRRGGKRRRVLGQHGTMHVAADRGGGRKTLVITLPSSDGTELYGRIELTDFLHALVQADSEFRRGV